MDVVCWLQSNPTTFNYAFYRGRQTKTQTINIEHFALEMIQIILALLFENELQIESIAAQYR